LVWDGTQASFDSSHQDRNFILGIKWLWGCDKNATFWQRKVPRVIFLQTFQARNRLCSSTLTMQLVALDARGIGSSSTDSTRGMAELQKQIVASLNAVTTRSTLAESDHVPACTG
jgi:hypothetical protein